MSKVMSLMGLGMLALLVAACGTNEQQTPASSTGPETSGGGAADSVPPEVADAIEEITSRPLYAGRYPTRASRKFGVMS